MARRARHFTLRSVQPLEHDIQGAILRYLTLDARVAWAHRFNTGAHVIEEPGQPRRFIRYAFKGCADILGQLTDGRFLAVECKRKGEHPTPEQAAFLAKVANNGGVSFVARCVEDAKTNIDSTHNQRQ